MEGEQPTTITANRSMLRALCVVSFLNTSFCLVVYGIGLLSMAMVAQLSYADYEALFQKQVNGLFDPEVMARSSDLLLLLHEHGVALMCLLLARTVARLIGVVLMWRGRLVGFHIYAVAQLAGIFLPHMVLPWSYLGFFGPLMTVGMTALYGSRIKQLK